MYSNRLYSPLRYPGGKASFAKYIGALMTANNLDGGHYLEPYAGGAGVALDLLFSSQASHIHINDADPAIYDFWTSVVGNSGALLDLLEATPITMEEWFKWRQILRGERTASQLERGFATLFMNRTNRSGILKAGVIGGVNQNGEYKLDARFKKEVVANRILEVASRANQISVYCEDSFDLLQRAEEFLPTKSLIYLDPPYYVKGKGLYRNYYQHEDHLEIAGLIQSGDFKWPWIVSYDNAAEINDMYGESKSLSYGLNYTAQRRYVGSEVMFFAPMLHVEEGTAPKSMKLAG